jgi:hypothetical protein
MQQKVCFMIAKHKDSKALALGKLSSKIDESVPRR